VNFLYMWLLRIRWVDDKKRNAHRYGFVSLRIELQIKFVWLFVRIEF